MQSPLRDTPAVTSAKWTSARRRPWAVAVSLLGQNVNLNDVLSVLDVVVSTIEHSDVTGGIGGYSVLASAADHRNANNEPDPLGMAGGFAGDIEGGHIQDSSSHEFVYIIGQVSAGGYVGTMQPGAVANVLGDGSVLKKLVNLDNLLSLVQDFTPTIRNSSTDAAVCGGAVRAQAASDTTTRRGMAGGYAGRNRGGHIWGNNTAAWKQENTDGKYNGPQRVAYAARIRSVYGAEIAGGYTGFMEAADTAQGGSLSLLGGLIKAGNLAGVLSVVYPTEEHTKVTGPLRNMSYDQWKTWVDNIGKYGAYGKEFTEVATGDGAGSVTDQDSLDKFLESYIFGFNVVAGRAEYQTGANLHDSGVAGGHVGLMRTGTITDGQSMDVKTVSAMRAAGGYAGTMESGSASSFGSIQLFGDKGIKLDLGQMLDVAQVFVPVVKSSSVAGYRKCMRSWPPVKTSRTVPVMPEAMSVSRSAPRSGAISARTARSLSRVSPLPVPTFPTCARWKGATMSADLSAWPLPVRLRMWTPMRPRDSYKESSTRWYRTRQVWSAYCRPRLRRFAVRM